MIKQNPSWEQQIEINMLRDSIAKASGSARGGGQKGYFLVFEVWKAMKNKKWFPSGKDDNLLWPFEKSSDQLKKYRIGVRRLSIDENNRTFGYMTDAGVEDGKNVHDVYRIVKDLASIVMIHYTVNI